jgi:hypothetical protein
MIVIAAGPTFGNDAAGGAAAVLPEPQQGETRPILRTEVLLTVDVFACHI